MQIKSISYKRTHNLGNYESETLEMSAELDYEEDSLFAFQKLKHTVETALGLNPPPANTDEEELDNTPF